MDPCTDAKDEFVAIYSHSMNNHSSPSNMDELSDCDVT